MPAPTTTYGDVRGGVTYRPDGNTISTWGMK